VADALQGLYGMVGRAAEAVVTPALRLPRFAAHHERLGTYPAELLERLHNRPVLWLHNASVGELIATRPLLARFRESLPGWRIVLTTTSLAGRELARGMPEGDGAVLLPLDSPGCVARALDALSPSLFVFTETEIWPCLLRALERRHVPAVLLSGRISPRAFRRYRWIRPLLRRTLAGVAVLGMQNESEAQRIRELGAPRERVRVTGSLKLDASPPVAAFEIGGGGALWIAASTHAGEEAACARAFVELRRRFAQLRLLLAPRHLDRLAEVESLLRGLSLPFVRRTELGSGGWWGDPPVLVLDTLGELSGLYSGAVAAFVGGTLAPVGGHNLLEPARAGIPVLFGPHVDNVAEVARALETKGGGIRVGDAEELAARLAALLADPAAARRIGTAARDALQIRGSVETSLHAALECLNGKR
jgi:3-deoxy-D-manno-octulosonic-acid transferase